MNKLAFFTFLFCPMLPGVLCALDEAPQVRIAARYEGFDRAQFPDIQKFNDSLGKRNEAGVLGTPSVTVKPGRVGTIEVIRTVPVPAISGGEPAPSAGVTLELKPIVKDGEITLSGKSVVRRQSQRAEAQSLQAVSFDSRETFFSGTIQEGKELTIALGDGPKDEARVILTVQFVDSSGMPIEK